MPGLEESLFSLELVVEKVYIPHVVCRFPAVAFRLLDFPTIVISHVEDELGKAIRRQISFDADYEIPQQFSELKDRHGNFMVKKGKSCLFKMVADNLKKHLSSTPLYVMVIDMFPEVPKLVGNSTVPLNVLIDAICTDLVRLGPTVPSVHGDKGLFKIYNLMGKEIGYFVLGFRLLCLGPSLIPHLPEASLIQRQSKRQMKQQKLENKQMVEMVQMSVGDDKGEEEEELIEMRTTGSMTDIIKHDVLMQTVEMDDKAVHVEMQAPTAAPLPLPFSSVHPVREIHTAATQTDKKGIKTALNVKKKIMEDLSALDEHDEVIVTNIVCPPPLFYNSEAKPAIEIDNDSYSLDTDMSVSDELTIDSLTDEEADETGASISKKEMAAREAARMDLGAIVSPPAPTSYDNVPLHVQFKRNQNRRKTDDQSKSPQAQGALSRVPGGFPLLSALINELLCIQNPGLLQGVTDQIQAMAAAPQQAVQFVHKPAISQAPAERSEKASAATSAAVSRKPSGMSVNGQALERDMGDDRDFHGRKSHRECAHEEAGGTKNKSQLRVGPQQGTAIKKNSKLTFGLTHTQRLRLQKTNPAWLRKMERAGSASRSGKIDRDKRHDSGDELNAENFADTLTEVRRLAQKELDKTGNDTLISNKDLNNSGSLMATPKRYRSKSQGKSPSKRQGASAGKMPDTPSPRPRRQQQQQVQRRQSQSERQSSEESDRPTRPMSVEKGARSIQSPGLDLIPPPGTGDGDDVQMSARSDLPSSRSRSIEVRLPNMQATHDDASEATLSDSEGDDDDALPLPDDSFSHDNRNSRGLGFPSYLKQSASLPESIEGRPNQSLNTSTGIDDNSPLESTRVSKIYTGEVQSADDYDTRQFHSTSEPELQELLSDEDHERSMVPDRLKNPEGIDRRFPIVNPMLSQQSPVPSTRHSVAKLELSRSQLPITPRGATTPRSSRSGSPKRPTPRPRRPLHDWRESIHTDSVSSYMPSDPDMPASFSSGEGNYSEDFLEGGSGACTPTKIAQLDKPHLIPSAKLGYTIH